MLRLHIYSYHQNYRPDKVSAVGHLTEDAKDGEGVDTAVSATFIYKNGRTARCQTHCRVELPCEGKIYGTKGVISYKNINYFLII